MRQLEATILLERSDMQALQNGKAVTIVVNGAEVMLHGESREFKCADCGMKFKVMQTLYNHRWRMRGKNGHRNVKVKK